MMQRERVPCGTAGFLRDGYRFISAHCDRRDTDLFETSLLGEAAVCMRGSVAAELFYDDARFSRVGAFPPRVQRTLLGEGGVQGLDGAAHRSRKGQFLALLDEPAADALAERFVTAWTAALPRWRDAGHVVLHEEVAGLLYRAAVEWMGLHQEEPSEPAAERMLSMIDAPAAVGPRHWRGRRARRRSERALISQVRLLREGVPDADPSAHSQLTAEGPAARIARHWAAHADGPLSERVAAVELLNLLRPTVAVARFVVFAALLLHRFPDWRVRLARADSESEREVDLFVREVRRVTPFFPAVAARVAPGAEFTWHGVEFPEDRRVLLDLYGTNRHPALWRNPDAFDPERFRDTDLGPYGLVPQGGGDHHSGHRCAGEWVTIALLKAAVRFLTREVNYRVPPQDLRVNLRRMPALPRSGMVLTHVAATGEHRRR